MNNISNIDFLRYSRQIFLKEIGISGQKKLKRSKILILGLGGIGSSASIYLASAGIGTLLLADYDLIEISNLHRQILYSVYDIKKSKASIAKSKLFNHNQSTKYFAIKKKINKKNIYKYINYSDLVLDCTDTMHIRQIVNYTCVNANKPLISASAIGFKGQILSIWPP